MKFRKFLTIKVVAALLLSFFATAQAFEASPVGVVPFENSGSADAQEPFLRGLALLHNFEYDRAAEEFRKAQTIDPKFAMAFWGEAMTYNHPVWMEQDRDAALAVLKRLGKNKKQRLGAAKTDRERAYLNAVEILYGDGDKKSRDFAYHDAMGAVHEAYPDDVNATAFYALSTLGLAHNGRDFALYMRAAGMLEEVFEENKNHPGVLHYLIHSYDDPIHAPLGLRAARLYSEVAPDAGHAQHMTSHIFVALGMWDEVIARNLQAVAVVKRQREEAGGQINSCGHYNEWLVYAYLQVDEVDRADEIITGCREAAQKELETNPSKDALELYWSRVFSYSDISMRRVMDLGEWNSDERLDLPEGKYLKSRMMRAYGDVMAARGDHAALKAANEKLKSIDDAMTEAEKALPDETPTYDRQNKVLLLQAAGLEELSAGNEAEGIAHLTEAAEAEAQLPIEFGPPQIAKPSYELLGEELERLGRKKEAADAYEKALAMMPNRRLSVEGLERVSK